MKILLNFFAWILALLGYLLIWINKEKIPRYKLSLVLLGVLLTSAVIWGKYYYDSRQSASAAKESALIQSKLTEIKEQNELLLSERDSLKRHMREIQASNKELTLLLEPFTEIARMSYPGSNDQEALQKLVSDVSKMQPKIVFLGQTEPSRDSVTNLLHTFYVFRSQYSIGLRDIEITVTFDGAFVSATPRIRGAIVQEYGSRMTIDADSSGFCYTTGYLSEGNDISIEVISRKPLKVTSMKLLP